MSVAVQTLAGYVANARRLGASAIWPMNDPVGSAQAADVSGGNLHMPLQTGSIWGNTRFGVPGPYGDGTAFQVVQGWPGLARGSPFPAFNLDAATICYWMNPVDRYGDLVIIGGAREWWPLMWWDVAAGGTNWQIIGGAQQFFGLPGAWPTNWVHVAGVVQGNQVRLFIDAVQRITGTITGLSVAASSLAISGDDYPIAALALFDYALTQAEIAELLAPPPPPEPGGASVWDGSEWVPASVQGWDGSQWRGAKVWDGQGWREL